MPRYMYRGDKRRELRFPLGGIGTGCVSLDGTGRLVDWEIFNHASKGSYNGYSHFAVKAENEQGVLDARVLNADLMPPYTGRPVQDARNCEYGFGPSRYLLTGMPHFEQSEFYGRFPECEVHFIDDSFPGNVTLSAFSPMIPLDDFNSSLPAAFFTLHLKNTTGKPLVYTGAFSVNNPATFARENVYVNTDGIQAITLHGGTNDASAPEYGAMGIAVDAAASASIQQYWYRGSWFDNLGIFWQNFTAPGGLHNRVYPKSEDDTPQPGEDMATIAVRVKVAPGNTADVHFVLGWHYPNYVNDWRKHTPEEGDAPLVWKNYYATRFESVQSVLEYCVQNRDSLEARTRAFSNALQSSTIPDEALEAATSNIAVLKTPTCLRLTDGSFYGWEGLNSSSGSCEGSCAHVWNYAFALAYLYPGLERSMRELDFTYNQRADGGMSFRLQLPLGSVRSNFRPCVDGEMGGVIKSYREWKISGDNEWLRKWWPQIKASLEFAWSPDNPDKWDPGKTGIITGRQHHTLDMELFGPNAWLNTFYLAALKAGAEMAEAMADAESAALYRELLSKGQAYTEAKLFNGEYYFQQVDIRDKAVLAQFGSDALASYWNYESNQIKYQIGEGCGIDQVLAQWMCDLVGLGDVLDPAHVRSALAAIYKNNFKQSFRFHVNPCRIYGLNDEAGLVICDWPEGREKPTVPVPYSEECMHGFEYQAACHMIGRGMIDEGLAAIRAIRDRYDGEKRNPWNEFECGNNYARSMASWALINTFSGFQVDMTKHEIGFKPVQALAEHRYFFSLEGAWGVFSMNDSRTVIEVREGELPLERIVLSNAADIKTVMFDSASLSYSRDNDAILLHTTIKVLPGMPITFETL